jgi:hypothetical protein
MPWHFTPENDDNHKSLGCVNGFGCNNLKPGPPEYKTAVLTDIARHLVSCKASSWKIEKEVAEHQD